MSPRSETLRRLGRFLASGLAVQAVYTAVMAITLLAAGLDRQVALAIAYLCALAVHFVLNRQFVFARAEGYVLGPSSHGVRYLAMAAVVYVVTAAGLEMVPEAIGVSPFVAWLLITGTIGALNFVMLDRLVFR